MTLKTKSLLFNFLGFATFFVVVRLTLGCFFPLSRLVIAIISAVSATILAPKFAVVKMGSEDKIVMKWIFKKG